MSKQLADNQDLLAMTHVGEDPEKYMKSVTPPIFMNSLHVFDTVKDYFDVDIFKDEFYYGRASNPTVAILEKKNCCTRARFKSSCIFSRYGSLCSGYS